MKIVCERCRKLRDCNFYGSASDVDEDKAQNGEWLCEKCVPLRAKEMDEDIEKMKSVLRD